MHPRSFFHAIEVVCPKMLEVNIFKVDWDLTIFMSRYFTTIIHWFPVLEAFRQLIRLHVAKSFPYR